MHIYASVGKKLKFSALVGTAIKKNHRCDSNVGAYIYLIMVTSAEPGRKAAYSSTETSS